MEVRPTPVDESGLQEKYDEWIEFISRAHHGDHPLANPEAPFTPLSTPVPESRIALLTTAGAHLDDQEPFHVETTAGDVSYRVIPDDVDLSRLRFTHTHYDTSSAEQDPNVVLPIDRLHQLVERVGWAQRTRSTSG